MQPITGFHRSVKHLFNERLELRRAIASLEGDHSQYANSKVLTLWSRIDEIDRQIGVAYYWHRLHEENPASSPELMEANKRASAPLE